MTQATLPATQLPLWLKPFVDKHTCVTCSPLRSLKFFFN